MAKKKVKPEDVEEYLSTHPPAEVGRDATPEQLAEAKRAAEAGRDEARARRGASDFSSLSGAYYATAERRRLARVAGRSEPAAPRPEPRTFDELVRRYYGETGAGVEPGAIASSDRGGK